MATAKATTRLPRGIRNNNPLNIRKSQNNWLGKVAGLDKDFETFDTMEHGIRAAFVIVRTYIRKHNCTTVTQLINRWAPATENDTSQYVASVLRLSLTSAKEPLRFERRLQMCTILWAMHIVENGKSYVQLNEFCGVYDKYFYKK